LPAGYAVEVYRHDGEGWCAIRPPEGSFSLAPAHQLKILDSRTAEETAAGVVARVGSKLGDQRNAVQVLLERGEVVKIVEQPTPGQPWIKIAPPAGEFRWIASRRLSRTPPVEGAPVQRGSWVGRPGTARLGTSPALGSQAVSSPTHVEDAPGGFSHLIGPATKTPNAPAPSMTPWRADAASSNASATSPLKPAEDIEVVEGSPAQVRLAQFEKGSRASAVNGAANEGTPAVEGSPSTPPRIRFSGISTNGPLDPRVAEMQLKLSQSVVQPPASWKLTSLREEAAALLAQEQSAPVRDQLRDLLDRIATFESVQARYTSTTTAPKGPVVIVPAGQQASAAAATTTSSPAPMPGMTGQSADVLARARADLGVDNSITPTPGGPATAQDAATPAATQALYDAVGTLKPVVSRRDKAPHYALVDDHGDVVTFVTASADLNLQPYVGKRIGVRGSRGFMPEYRRAHVVATRITPLEEKLIR
jgi:hypothetical protein